MASAAISSRATAAAATELGWPVIVLVGQRPTTRDSGSSPRARIGIEPPQPWSDEVWMALRLPSWTPGWRGTMHYPPAFAID